MATYWENSCSFGLRYVSWYKYLIVSLVFSHLGFWSGNLFLIAPFPDLCLLVPFYGELQEGKRSQGGQKKRYKDTLKASLKDFEIPMGSWEQTAQERSKWRGLINKGAVLYEEKRICEAERKRRERKAKTNVPPADSMTLTCSTCNRQFRARIGLVSHQRTHQHTSALFKK